LHNRTKQDRAQVSTVGADLAPSDFRHPCSPAAVPFFRSYADPGIVTDEIIRLYLMPLLSSPERIDAFQRYWLAFDSAQTVAIHAALQRLDVPTLIVWGLEDIFFDRKWAYWLKETIPGARPVIEVPDGRLFFPEDRPDALVAPMLALWDDVDALRPHR
jgi:pimeloyl-ACP methyl ester carboxylesterase